LTVFPCFLDGPSPLSVFPIFYHHTLGDSKIGCRSTTLFYFFRVSPPLISSRAPPTRSQIPVDHSHCPYFIDLLAAHLQNLGHSSRNLPTPLRVFSHHPLLCLARVPRFLLTCTLASTSEREVRSLTFQCSFAHPSLTPLVLNLLGL